LARDSNPGTLPRLDAIVTEQESSILSRNAAERAKEKVSATHVRDALAGAFAVLRFTTVADRQRTAGCTGYT
jgi:hypothetical protein